MLAEHRRNSARPPVAQITGGSHLHNGLEHCYMIIVTDNNEQENRAAMEQDLQRLTARIVSAYTANNSVAASDLPTLIRSVYSALDRLGKEPAEQAPAERQKPAVPIKRSVTPGYIVCLECGKMQKTLRRHLGSEHGMTPDEYRAKWNLPREYPMTAPDYAEARSQMAKAIGLGRRAGQRRGKKR